MHAGAGAGRSARAAACLLQAMTGLTVVLVFVLFFFTFWAEVFNILELTTYLNNPLYFIELCK